MLETNVQQFRRIRRECAEASVILRPGYPVEDVTFLLTAVQSLAVERGARYARMLAHVDDDGEV